MVDLSVGSGGKSLSSGFGPNHVFLDVLGGGGSGEASRGGRDTGSRCEGRSWRSGVGDLARRGEAWRWWRGGVRDLARRRGESPRIDRAGRWWRGGVGDLARRGEALRGCRDT